MGCAKPHSNSFLFSLSFSASPRDALQRIFNIDLSTLYVFPDLYTTGSAHFSPHCTMTFLYKNLANEVEYQKP